VIHHANAESTRATVSGTAASLQPKACPAPHSLSGAVQRRDRGATPQTGLSLASSRGAFPWSPSRSRRHPRHSAVRSLFPGVRVSARSGAGGPSNARGFPASGLGRPRSLRTSSRRSAETLS
jgi:hypothetical protein